MSPRYIVLLLAAAWMITASVARAEPCNVPADCGSGFCVDGVCCDSACTDACHACTAAKKGGGEDGTCGQMPAGALCAPAHCDGNAFAFVDDSFCDAAGVCVAPAGVDCLKNEPCKFDLCGDSGCEQVTMTDGTVCGDALVCTDGMCGRGTSSSSAASGAGGGGAGGGPASAGGPGVGAGGPGGTEDRDLYPPREDDGGCGCRSADGAGRGGPALLLCAAALAWRRRRR